MIFAAAPNVNDKGVHERGARGKWEIVHFLGGFSLLWLNENDEYNIANIEHIVAEIIELITCKFKKYASNNIDKGFPVSNYYVDTKRIRNSAD